LNGSGAVAAEPNSPRGQRFSQVYLRNGDLLPDSRRMRRRIGTLIDAHFSREYREIFARELGVAISSNAEYTGWWPEFMEKAELRDVLDSITLLYQYVTPTYYLNDQSLREWTREQRKAIVGEARRIFLEEHVRYRVDDQGGIHFSVDAEFERSRIATLRNLGAGRYAGVAKAFEDAFAALDRTPPDAKAAVRAVFFATEGLFRLMFPKAALLGTGEIDKYLRPRIDAAFSADRVAHSAAQKCLTSFREWVSAVHNYRHEPGTEEPAHPPSRSQFISSRQELRTSGG
jgi:hypothetical protein